MFVKKFIRDFKTFALQGNVMNLAVGVMIGGAFNKIVTSLVGDIFTPILGLITGGVDFSGLFIALDGKRYDSIQAATAKGVGTLNYGAFLTNIIDFVLIALCIFMVVKMIGKFFPKKEAPAAENEKPAARLCPYCFSEIAAKATRCPHCTSALPPEVPRDAAATA
ncbi:MAG: large conductance mechanosensitive channel protein MscL [Firmicutes bacterium]|nr:large conductance mechanosensitive channel protein MscL [Bacillota bacterium]